MIGESSDLWDRLLGSSFGIRDSTCFPQRFAKEGLGFVEMASRKHHQQGDLPKPGHFEHVALNSWFLSSNRGEPPITPIVYGYIWLSITSFIMFYHVLSSLAIYWHPLQCSDPHSLRAKSISGPRKRLVHLWFPLVSQDSIDTSFCCSKTLHVPNVPITFLMTCLNSPFSTA